jgi:HEAT repeat protein
MKRWRVVGGVLLVAAAFGSAVWQAVRPPSQIPEPVYEGRVFVDRATHGRVLVNRATYIRNESHPLSFWLTNFASGTVMFPPQGLLGDSNAVPFLIRALERDSWSGAAYYRKWLWPRLPASIQRRLPRPTDNWTARYSAAYALGIPALIRALKTDDNPNVRGFASHALDSLGRGDKAAIAALTKELGNKDKTAVAALTEALKDKDLRIRAAATNALLTLDPEAAAKAGVKIPPS